MEQMKAYAQAKDKTRPYIMCEYSHAMGNGNGNFQAYWDIIRSSKQMQGGFIWDWVDQGLKAKNANGKPIGPMAVILVLSIGKTTRTVWPMGS